MHSRMVHIDIRAAHGKIVEGHVKVPLLVFIVHGVIGVLIGDIVSERLL